MFSQKSHTPDFGPILFKKKYASVYSINPAHHRQETKESILLLELIVFIACRGWYTINRVEETKKFTMLKINKRVVCVRKTMVYRVNQAKTIALNTLT